ncbi:transcriptional regulator, GntR family [Desulfocicer vacuolatum DSM 3385]|uniref:Transcriptional regulator, GntR family n=1 Tax=Desulfocicer vacuolatum DSM 3385 TaxID=1121400 RepID=A0A1W2EI86_9BACT|nr:GntR family transcriptional regulator [Desulfocicer vacuolatum]SMD09419.1 transcriptional regulator, GntR family [Desulfocicer vacuolatum DSM 3385]
MKKKYPKYEKIKDYIIQGIHSKKFTHAIPSENQLAKQFGVSRMTARKAFDQLHEQGLLERIPGKGSFVKKNNHYTSGFFWIRPFKKWAEDLHVELTSEILDARIIDPPENVDKMLAHDGKVVIIRQLWFFDNKPVRYAIRYLRADKYAGMLWENLQERSIHDLLINKYDIPINRASQSMTAIVLDQEMAPLFKVDPGYPVFRIQRVLYSAEEPVTYVEFYMRGEMAFMDTFTPRLESSDFVEIDE